MTLSAGNPTLGEAFARRLQTALAEAEKDGPVDPSRAVRLIEENLLSLAKEGGEDAVTGRQILIGGVTGGGM